jgi:hypothetical protein
MGKIVKTDLSPYEERLAKRFKGESDAEPVERIISDDKGNLFQLTEGFGAKLMTEYSRPDPAFKLSALQKTQKLVADYLYGAKLMPFEVIELLMENHALLGDMLTHANNPLIDYARTPGRRGSRKDSHWDANARRCLVIAARAHRKLAKMRGPATDRPSLRKSCQHVWDTVDQKLKKIGVGPLEKRLPGEWRKDTPERREQKKLPATGGERIEGWGDEFKKKKDTFYLVYLNALDLLQSPVEIERYFERMLNGGLNRLTCGLPGVSKKPREPMPV